MLLSIRLLIFFRFLWESAREMKYFCLRHTYTLFSWWMSAILWCHYYYYRRFLLPCHAFFFFALHSSFTRCYFLVVTAYDYSFFLFHICLFDTSLRLPLLLRYVCCSRDIILFIYAHLMLSPFFIRYAHADIFPSRRFRWRLYYLRDVHSSRRCFVLLTDSRLAHFERIYYAFSTLLLFLLYDSALCLLFLLPCCYLLHFVLYMRYTRAFTGIRRMIEIMIYFTATAPYFTPIISLTRDIYICLPCLPLFSKILAISIRFHALFIRATTLLTYHYFIDRRLLLFYICHIRSFDIPFHTIIDILILHTIYYYLMLMLLFCWYYRCFIYYITTVTPTFWSPTFSSSDFFHSSLLPLISIFFILRRLPPFHHAWYYYYCCSLLHMRARAAMLGGVTYVWCARWEKYFESDSVFTLEIALRWCCFRYAYAMMMQVPPRAFSLCRLIRVESAMRRAFWAELICFCAIMMAILAMPFIILMLAHILVIFCRARGARWWRSYICRHDDVILFDYISADSLAFHSMLLTPSHTATDYRRPAWLPSLVEKMPLFCFSRFAFFSRLMMRDMLERWCCRSLMVAYAFSGFMRQIYVIFMIFSPQSHALICCAMCHWLFFATSLPVVSQHHVTLHYCHYTSLRLFIDIWYRFWWHVLMMSLERRWCLLYARCFFFIISGKSAMQRERDMRWCVVVCRCIYALDARCFARGAVAASYAIDFDGVWMAMLRLMITRLYDWGDMSIIFDFLDYFHIFLLHLRLLCAAILLCSDLCAAMAWCAEIRHAARLICALQRRIRDISIYVYGASAFLCRRIARYDADVSAFDMLCWVWCAKDRSRAVPEAFIFPLPCHFLFLIFTSRAYQPDIPRLRYFLPFSFVYVWFYDAEFDIARFHAACLPYAAFLSLRRCRRPPIFARECSSDEHAAHFHDISLSFPGDMPRQEIYYLCALCLQAIRACACKRLDDAAPSRHLFCVMLMILVIIDILFRYAMRFILRRCFV